MIAVRSAQRFELFRRGGKLLDQAVFEWRGATPEYILNPDRYFESRFETMTLAVNYRSPSNIVELSQRLIKNNTRRVPTKITPALSESADIAVKTVLTIRDALKYVDKVLKKELRSRSGRVAIIGSKRSQIIPYQVHFAANDVPFCAAEDLQLFLSDAFERLLELLMIKEQAKERLRPRVSDFSGSSISMDPQRLNAR